MTTAKESYEGLIKQEGSIESKGANIWVRYNGQKDRVCKRMVVLDSYR